MHSSLDSHLFSASIYLTLPSQCIRFLSHERITWFLSLWVHQFTWFFMHKFTWFFLHEYISTFDLSYMSASIHLNPPSVVDLFTKWINVLCTMLFLFSFSLILSLWGFYLFTALRAAYSLVIPLAFSQCTLSVNHFHFLSHFYSSSLWSVEFRLQLPHNHKYASLHVTGRHCLYLDLQKLSAQTELLSASDWAALCFRLSCSLLQTELLSASDWAALFFRLSCSLLQTELLSASDWAALCFRLSCSLLQTELLSASDCVSCSLLQTELLSASD